MTAFLIYISVATITVDCFKFIIKHLVYKLILAKNCQKHISHSFKHNLGLLLIRRCEIVYENEQIQINLSLRKPLYFDTTHFNYDMFDDIILIRWNYNMIILIIYDTINNINFIFINMQLFLFHERSSHHSVHTSIWAIYFSRNEKYEG